MPTSKLREHLFHLDAKTAYRVLNEFNLGLTRFSIPPLNDHSALYGINFRDRKLFTMTRSKKPRRKLTFDQVAMLMLTPIEAHEELIRTM